MRFINHLISGFTVVLLLTAVTIDPVLAQQQPAQTPADDVVRINAELVQTAVTVVDKNGAVAGTSARQSTDFVVQ